MNKKLIAMGWVSGTAVVTSLGIVLPELYMGIASMGMGSTSLYSALQAYRDSAKRKINKMLLEELR